MASSRVSRTSLFICWGVVSACASAIRCAATGCALGLSVLSDMVIIKEAAGMAWRGGRSRLDGATEQNYR